MTVIWSNPAVLWALLLLPPLALLLMILPRARRIRVSSIRFWIDPHEAAPVEQARRWRLLDVPSILLLIALAALIMALAGPALVRRQPVGPALVVLIDRSASMSMKTADGNASRAERLARQLDDVLASLPPDIPLEMHLLPNVSPGTRFADAVRLDDAAEDEPATDHPPMPAGQVLHAQASFSGTPGAARQWLTDNFRPVYQSLDSVALRQAVQAAGDRSAAAVLLVSDITPYRAESQIAAPPGVWVLASGGQASNIALTQALVEQRDEKLFALVEYSRCGNWDVPRVAPLQIIVSDPQGRALATHTLSAAQETTATVADEQVGRAALSFPLPEQAADMPVLDFAITAADDLPADNRLQLVRQQSPQLRIGYVGRGDDNLLWLLSLMGHHVLHADQPELLPDDVQLTIFLDRQPPPGFRGAAIVVNPPGAVGPMVPGPVAVEPLTLAPADDELARLLPEAMATVRRWRPATVPPGVAVLLEGRAAAGNVDAQPMAVRYSTPGGDVVLILADISATSTDWPARPGYVVFWNSILARLAPEASAVTRWQSDRQARRVAGVEGLQCTGEAVDELAQARRAALRAERQVRPVIMPLWPIAAILALAALAGRLWLMR